MGKKGKNLSTFSLSLILKKLNKTIKSINYKKNECWYEICLILHYLALFYNNIP